MHMVLDENGKVQVPQQLMEALGIRPGDMLSFHFDEQGIHVQGREKPPYYHDNTLAPARGSQRQALPPSTDPTPVTQMSFFKDSQPQHATKRSRRRK